MSTSILNDTKKLLGIEADIDNFDQDIIIGINSTLVGLKQIGVLENNFSVVEDSDTLWSDVFATRDDLQLIKSYLYLKVRLFFDPPSNSFLVDAIQRQINEHEWRLREENEIYEEVI